MYLVSQVIRVFVSLPIVVSSFFLAGAPILTHAGEQGEATSNNPDDIFFFPFHIALPQQHYADDDVDDDDDGDDDEDARGFN